MILRDIAGRAEEMDVALGALRGSSPLVILGEPGLGKTRLVQTAAAAAPDVCVLIGRCQPLSVPLPLLPLVDVVRELAERDGGVLLREVDDSTPRWVMTELARLVPELASADTTVARDNGQDEDDPTGDPSTEDGWRRRRLFEALRQCLGAVATVRSVAVVIEDLHWADESTLDALSYLIARPPHHRGVPLVLTCRDEGLDPVVAQWLERVWSTTDAVRLQLSELDLQATRRQIELALGSDPGSKRAGQIHARSGGNPFFTEQLLSDLGPDAGRTLPVGLEAALASRLRRLDGLALHVLQVLAVADRPLPEATLVAVCGADPMPLRTAIRALSEHRLVRSPLHGDDGSYELRHVLLGEVVRSHLLREERVELHSGLAERMLAEQSGREAAVLADHLMAAGRPAEEMHARVTAAMDAEAVFARVEALRQYERAIALWDLGATSFGLEFPRAELGLVPRTMTVLQMWRHGWMAAERAGMASTAESIGERAVVSLAGRADVDDLISLQTDLGHVRRLGSQHGAVTALQHAIALGGSPAARADLVQAHSELAAILSMAGDFAGARRHVMQADCLLAPDDRAAQCTLGAVDAWLLAALGDTASSASRLDGVLLSAEDLDPVSRVALEGRVGDLLLDSGRLPTAVARGLPALVAAERVGVSQSFWTEVVRFNVCEALVEGGEVAAAAELMGPPSDPAEFLFRAVVRADISLRQGRLAHAAELWSRLRMTGELTSLRREYSVRRLEFSLWQEGPEQVLVQLRESVKILTQICATDQSQFIGTLLAMAMRACADVAEQARDRAEPQHLAAALTALSELDDAVSAAPRDPFSAAPLPLAAASHGLSWAAERRRVHGVVDPALWEQAAAGWQQLGRPHRAAYAAYRQAEGLLADRDGRPGAAPVLRLASSLAQEHAPLHAAIRALARRARIDLDRDQQPGSTNHEDLSTGLGRNPRRDSSMGLDVADDLGRIPVGSVPAGNGVSSTPGHLRGVTLTEREAAVLDLLVEGRTNAEIGARLFISPKTAGVHVTNILRKLGVTSRVQAAVIGARSGRAPASPSGSPL